MTPWVKWSESSDLCFKFSSAESSYSISFTNLSCVWKEEKTDDEISQKSENLNPSIEASNKRITSIVGSVVNDEKARQSSYVYLSEDGNRKLVIKMEQRLENLPFVWEFEPELQTKEQLKEDIVLPLLYSLVEMEYRERELIHIIKRKDAEIEDYKATGAKVSRKQLETKPFEESKFGESLSGIHRVGLQSPSDIFSKSSPNIFCKISRLIVDGELKPNLIEIKPVAGEKKTLAVQKKRKEATIMESDEDRRRKIEEQLKKEEEEEKMKKKKRKIKL